MKKIIIILLLGGIGGYYWLNYVPDYCRQEKRESRYSYGPPNYKKNWETQLNLNTSNNKIKQFLTPRREKVEFLFEEWKYDKKTFIFKSIQRQEKCEVTVE